MNFVYTNTMGAYPQQAFYNTSVMANSQWLLQQPKDSGYASDDHNLFEKAFESQLPSIPQVASNHMSQQTPMSAFSDSSCSESSSNGSHSSPFEYADSLCTPSNYDSHWNPYESLDLSVKKLSIDAGITSMTGYCDIDSMLTAAYHNTSASQPKRFSAFSQSPPRSSSSNQQSRLQQQDSSVEAPTSPALGRPRGSRVDHQKVEQRYRANLSDNFERLRNSVPEIATLQPARSGQPPKPSKAEVLAAAAEYIRQLEEENDMLRESMMNAAAGELRRKRAKTD
ncbi:hypothetical protein KCU61_g2396, partial [Aureobasidium melanogenum]